MADIFVIATEISSLFSEDVVQPIYRSLESITREILAIY